MSALLEVANLQKSFGGIRAVNVQEWLGLESVLCVGGTWLYAGPGDTTAEVAKRARALRDTLAAN